MKAVLDTSVFVSAFLKRNGVSGGLVEHARRGRFKIVTSRDILQETQSSLGRRQPRYGYSLLSVDRFVDGISAMAFVVGDLPEVAPVCRDPNDEHVLAAAIAAKADVIVAGDKDLLTIGEYDGIDILSVRTFLDMLT